MPHQRSKKKFFEIPGKLKRLNSSKYGHGRQWKMSGRIYIQLNNCRPDKRQEKSILKKMLQTPEMAQELAEKLPISFKYWNERRWYIN